MIEENSDFVSRNLVNRLYDAIFVLLRLASIMFGRHFNAVISRGIVSDSEI